MGDQLSCFSKQYMMGEEKYLLYIIVITIAPVKDWNENSPKSCLMTINLCRLPLISYGS